MSGAGAESSSIGVAQLAGERGVVFPRVEAGAPTGSGWNAAATAVEIVTADLDWPVERPKRPSHQRHRGRDEGQHQPRPRRSACGADYHIDSLTADIGEYPPRPPAELSWSTQKQEACTKVSDSDHSSGAETTTSGQDGCCAAKPLERPSSAPTGTANGHQHGHQTHEPEEAGDRTLLPSLIHTAPSRGVSAGEHDAEYVHHSTPTTRHLRDAAGLRGKQHQQRR